MVSIVSICLLWIILLCQGSHRQMWYFDGSHKSWDIPSHKIASDLPMIDLCDTVIRLPMIAWWLMNRSGALGHVGWLHNWRLHDRSRPSHTLWMTAALKDWQVNLEVQRTVVFPSSDFFFARAILRFQLCNLRFALRMHSRICLLMRLVPMYVWAIGPFPNRARCLEEAITLAKSGSSYQSCTTFEMCSGCSVVNTMY